MSGGRALADTAATSRSAQGVKHNSGSARAYARPASTAGAESQAEPSNPREAKPGKLNLETQTVKSPQQKRLATKVESCKPAILCPYAMKPENF